MEVDSTRSPNNQHFLPSGIRVLGIDVWMRNLADVILLGQLGPVTFATEG